ncbi:MAG: aminotransferase class I/II-fold pyridoxal phosphate-dependent enzyme [Bacteroidetes bacterium]|nr:aminotransferase class I/II-fold pyridoxal phosphate-dependent enzyme [Bacteroidota bacterium]
MKIISRLPEIGTSIFSIMSKMALEHHALNLSQGFPDFSVSEKLIDLLYQKMKEGHNQYAPMPGLPALRKIISDVIFKTYQREVNADTDVTITAGGTEAIFSSIAAFIRPGDEVLLFDPSYDSYDPAIRLNGGLPVHLNLWPPHFAIDWDEVKKNITAHTRMIMVNTPHNPAGSVLRSSDLKVLQELAEEHNLIVLSDEVYERIIFDNQIHESVLKYPRLANRSIAIFSFGKTFHATGWKVGYAVAPEILSNEIRKAHQFITFSVNTPVQWALADFMADSENYLHLKNFYQQKRDFFLHQIKGTSLKPLPCHGSYFQLLSYEGVSQKNDRDMAQWMTKEMKLAPIPVSAFYKDLTDHKLLRFCFAKNEDTLQKAGEILKRI